MAKVPKPKIPPLSEAEMAALSDGKSDPKSAEETKQLSSGKTLNDIEREAAEGDLDRDRPMLYSLRGMESGSLYLTP